MKKEFDFSPFRPSVKPREITDKNKIAELAAFSSMTRTAQRAATKVKRREFEKSREKS